MITTILGCGTMGQAMLRANLLFNKNPNDFRAVTGRLESAQSITERFRVRAGTDGAQLVDGAHLVVLGVKPNKVESVLREVAQTLSPDTTILSLAAGITSSTIESLLPQARVIRAMPNLGARIGMSATSVSLGAFARPKDLERAREFLEPAGSVTEVDEHLINAVMGVAGSAPAWFFTVLEAVIDAGVSLGLTYEEASQMAVSTMESSAVLVRESGEDPAVLRKQVCSPGGTTIAGMAAAEEAGLRAAVIAAVRAAHDRGVELG